MRIKKIFFVVYCIVVSVLSIGWYPREKEMVQPICETIEVLREKSKHMAVLAENGRFCSQRVVESDEEQRLMSVQMEEKERREVKAVVPYRISLDSGSRHILERIVEAEAGDQDISGRQMVANVIINRIKSEEFPDTVKKVVFAHRQFSPISNGSYYRVKVSSLTKKAVEKALKEKDNTRGALYFMYRAGSSAGNISWFDRDLTRLYQHGCHEFFK